MKRRLLDTAARTLVRAGLDGWTVEAVTRDAGCAKGLVHYHYRSKSELLAAVAESLARASHHRRVEALRGAAGAEALDALWTILSREVTSGEFTAWLGLLGLPDPRVRQSMRPTPGDSGEISLAAAAALGLPDDSAETGRIIEAGLLGFQIALLRGEPAEGVRESYHRFWLGVLG